MPRGLFKVSIACLVLVGCRGHRKIEAPHEKVAHTEAPAAKRVIAFASASIDAAGFEHVTGSTPPLPAGLHVDAFGHLVGRVGEPIVGRLYMLAGERGPQPLYLEIVPRPMPTDRFVSPDGNDDGEGSRLRPFRTVHRALTGVAPGTTVFLRAGRYREDVAVLSVHGESGRPIVLRSYPGEQASIEGAWLDVTWVKPDGAEAAPDEWISSQPIDFSNRENPANRGAFFGRVPYTKLLTYSQLEDLRASNQRWELDGPAPGPNVTKGPRRPWAYFGPGIWHDPSTGTLHLRLSPTANHIVGLADYDGPRDPSKLQLGIWRRTSVPLRIQDSAHLEIHDLEIIGGGERSVQIERVDDALLDHVTILAGSLGLTITESSRIRFVHGRIDGGIPPWNFRSDYKDNYSFTGPDGAVVENDLIRKTSRALLHVSDNNREIEIAYCELENGHDNIMAGIHSELHHCRMRNIHDDSMFVSQTKQIDDMRIHDNVFERVLTGLSGEGHQPTGPRYVYRNIFDMREPTAGFRPGLQPEAWRWGFPFKGDFSAGPLYFYQNTLLLGRPGEQATSMLFRSLEPSGVAVNPRWFLNNIVAVDQHVVDRTLAWVPTASYLQSKRPDGASVLRSDGNVWMRAGTPTTPLFRCLKVTSERCTTREWTSLEGLHETGFEEHSKMGNGDIFVQLRSLTAAGADDDLRPRPRGPALGTGVSLPPELPDSAPHSDHPDVGALPAGSPPLRIGVDGRLSY